MRQVLLVGDYPPPWGGLSAQITALRGRLATLGDDVVVLDIGANRRQIRPDCLPTPGPATYARTLIAHARRGFIVHLHTNGHNARSWLAAAIAAAVGHRAGRRAVLSLGSGRLPAFLRETSHPYRLLARGAARAAGACIVRNEEGRAALLALGVPHARVRIVSGFYGVMPREIGHLPLAAAHFRRGHRPLLGVIASRGPEYGLALFVDAAARLRARHPELGVLLIGPDRLPEGHPAWVLPLGELDRPALLAVVRTLDVFVRPTYFDGDASSVREALAMGGRVVASDACPRPEAVRTFPSGDAEALAATIDAALLDVPSRVTSSALPELLEVYDTLVMPAAAAPPGAPPACAPRPGAPPPPEETRVA